jgi:phage FluMu protein Com
MRVEIRCPKCNETFDPRVAKPYDICEGPQGEDVVTFNCPHCKAKRQQSRVWRVR